MSDFWVVMSGVSLLAHAALNKAARHAYTEMSYATLMKAARMNWHDYQEKFDDWLYKEFDFTSTGSFSSGFYAMGYTSQNVVKNVGPINYVVLGFIICICLQILFWPKFCANVKMTKSLTKRVKKC